jgi:spore coat polysaccharide biosynthesis protein SpsF
MEGIRMSRSVAFIQARMSSSRFPGKVLELLQDMPMIVYMARRTAQASLLDDVVVVTSTDPSDDELVQVVEQAGLKAFRGDLNDVLGRFVAAAANEQATEVVRLTGDCPLIDPRIIDAVIQVRRDNQSDYSSNVDPPTYPDGLDVECFTREALDITDAHANTPAEREHVTLWMRSQSSGLSRTNHVGLADFSHLRLTVDYPDDLEAVRRLISTLNPSNIKFDFYDLMRGLAAEKHILDINRHDRNEGLAKSLAKPRSKSA